ncbi:MAG TPA: hypothetical protein VFD36_27450, partial [Kofleriaceae bacterium]|nr:hypothetical protein [Kofleriaceae bacterium]
MTGHEAAGERAGARSVRHQLIDLIALVKPRIMMMALLTAAGAMSLAPGAVAPGRALCWLWLMAGTALIVGSANT